MSKHLNRRAILAGSAAVPIATATALAGNGDVELRRLWAEYLRHAAADAAARERTRPARAAFDAEFPPCPDDVLPGHHWAAHKWLWRKHGLDRLSDDWNAIDSAMRETIAAILRTPAQSLFGVGVKLTALPSTFDDQDCVDAAAAVRRDIDGLIGSNFTALIATSQEDAS